MIRENELGTIATVNGDEMPEAATVRYASHTFDLFFETSVLSEKYLNLQSNPKTAFVITPEFDKRTLQMKGRTRELMGTEEEEAKKRLIKQFGRSSYFFMPTTRFMQFSPYWFRYTNGLFKPAKVEEMHGHA